MKFTLGWLKEHLETSASLTDIAQALTSLGLEVEGVEDPAQKYAAFKVAYVVKAEPHPDADRLKVCLVDTGAEKLQVVCGAPNARTGMKGIFAPAGSYIPGTDMVLKKGVIRGQESNGMLVSEREMGLSNEHEGIIDLPDQYAVGTPMSEIFGLNDPIIEIALTPDRGDCAGVRGIARDLAAAGLGTLKPLDQSPVKGSGQSPVSVTIESPDQCPLFMGRMIRNIRNGESPDWMKKRLKAVGLRPISALVDMTNYLSLDLCRPLHVYDADLLKGDIVVRLSKKGENFDALNDKSYTLDEGMTVITDQSGVLGLGGIVGGVSTGCTEQTTSVFLECAYFTTQDIARTGRTLQIDSDARYRFERGVDPAFTISAIEVATRMILALCGGEVSDVVQAGAAPDLRKEIPFDPSYTLKLSGMDVPKDKQEQILKNLGFEIKNSTATPPSWRHDVEGKADLVEEIVRVIGYDSIPSVSVRSDNTVVDSAETYHVRNMRLARSVLSARGFLECVTWSFMRRDLAQEFGANDNHALTLSNPISMDLEQMRPSILPHLMDAAKMNEDKGNGQAMLFEVGPVFETARPDGQRTHACGLRYGRQGQKHWSSAEANRPHDIFDVKADVLAVLESLGVSPASLQTTREAASHYHPGRSGVLKQGKLALAQFGEIHPAILDQMDMKSSVMGFEIFIDAIPQGKRKGSQKPLLQLSPFQPLTRDFAFIVDETLEVEQITRAAQNADRQMVRSVAIFDIYQGKGVEQGKKSVAISVTLQPVKQTLTDSEIEGLGKKIIDSVAAKTGAVLRA